jgi:hypothetical protein
LSQSAHFNVGLVFVALTVQEQWQIQILSIEAHWIFYEHFKMVTVQKA